MGIEYLLNNNQGTRSRMEYIRCTMAHVRVICNPSWFTSDNLILPEDHYEYITAFTKGLRKESPNEKIYCQILRFRMLKLPRVPCTRFRDTPKFIRFLKEARDINNNFFNFRKEHVSLIGRSFWTHTFSDFQQHRNTNRSYDKPNPK